MTDTPFTLRVTPGYERVADQFRDNFKGGAELGAQFCVALDGDVIIDMIGGWADKTKARPVTDDTLMSVYSSGKAAAALVIGWLVDQDRIGYDQAVASIWPDFAAHGKGNITIGQALSHQAGLSGISDPDWTREDWFNWDKTVSTLAAQAPLFAPGTASGYHPVTYGFLAGEIARRADKDMRSLGQILREEITAPHDLDVWIGLPTTEHERCAEMIKPKAMAKFGRTTEAMKYAFFQKWSSAGGTDITRWRSAELAGSNCQATARGLALMMQAFNDAHIGERVLLSEDMPAKMRAPQISGSDLVLPFDLTFAAGVMHNAPNMYFGPNGNTIGHSGWGGSCVFADQQTGLSGCYAMNLQSPALLGDPRAIALINAVYDAHG